MRYLLNAIPVGLTLLLAASIPQAKAQPYPQPGDPYASVRAGDQERLMERTQNDIDQVEIRTLPLTPDRIRVLRARERIEALEHPMDAGEYTRDLDDAIAAVQRIADSNRNLTDADRDNLASDLSRMRDYEAWLDGSQ